eukprot:m.209263 g.209263  ORF g.209263 m.209263 type:complete len:450 (-) comp24509_c0_seq1:37-1386(-)
MWIKLAILYSVVLSALLSTVLVMKTAKHTATWQRSGLPGTRLSLDNSRPCPDANKKTFAKDNSDTDNSDTKHELGLPGSSDCGGPGVELVVGILASPSPRSTQARDVIRQTWMTFPVPKGKVTVRFLLALDKHGRIPPYLADEAHKFHDMVFLDTLDTYKNLVRKVHLFFVWVVASCPATARVFKTDDDTFVRLDRLYALANTLPSKQLYFGTFLRGMPARKKDRKTGEMTRKALDGNVQNMPEWPLYASGGGYLLTGDVVRLLAHPPMPVWDQTAEDRAVGIALFGYNITYQKAETAFKPWGQCHKDAVLLHYQRDPQLIRRRFERAVKGENICGEGWPKNQVCVMIEQKKHDNISCPEGTTIEKVLYADLGKHGLSNGYKGPCSEGMSAMHADPSCTYSGVPSMASIIESRCKGQEICTLHHDLRSFNISDPCPRTFKRLLTAVQCA